MTQELAVGKSLEQLIDHRGKTPHKLGSEFTESGVPVVSAVLVRDGRLDLEQARFVDAATFTRWMKVPTKKGDVILTSEAPLGRVARVASDDPLVLGQRVFGLRGRNGVLDSGYLYYALQTDRVQSELIGRSTGTTVLGIRQSALRKVIIPAPSYAEQVAIAEVLGALDDKIAANERILHLSDDLVRARFEALNGEMVPLMDLADNIRVQVSPDNLEPSTPYVGLEHIPRRRMWLTEHDTAAIVTSAKSAFVRGDVLFGKLRPYFHKVVWAPTDGVTSTDVLVIRAKDPKLSGYVIAAAAADRTIREATGASEGTRMPRTKWSDVRSVEVPWPEDSVARRFSAEVLDLAAMAEHLFVEFKALARTRDELLPLLMSGKVRVKDAEKAVEEVI